jgi:hypothetical protein
MWAFTGPPYLSRASNKRSQWQRIARATSGQTVAAHRELWGTPAGLVAEAIARVLSRYAVDFKSGVEVTFRQDGINVAYVAKPAINLAHVGIHRTTGRVGGPKSRRWSCQSIVRWIYDPHNSLAARMYVDVPNLHSLPITPPVTIQRLNHLILKPKKLDRVASV